MDYLEIARTRQSCRAYDAARPVEEEVMALPGEKAVLKIVSPSWKLPGWPPLPATPSPITSP